MKRQLTVLLMLLALAGTAWSGEKIKIGYMTIPMSLPTFVAVERGLFEQEGLKVEITPFESSTLIISALMAGRIDASCSSGVPGFWFAEQSTPGQFKIFLTYGSSSLKIPSFVVVTKKDSPLKDLKDLKGKRLGTCPPGVTSVAMTKAIIRTQMDPESVIFQELPPSLAISALTAGSIDAFFGVEPLGMMAISQGKGRYLIDEPGALLGLQKGFVSACFGFSAQFIKQNPLLAKKLKSVYYKSVDLIDKNRNAVRPLLVRYLGFPEWVAMNIPLTTWMKIETLDREATQQYFDLLYKEGAYKKKMDTTKLYYEDK